MEELMLGLVVMTISVAAFFLLKPLVQALARRLEERIEFTERLLAQRKDQELLPRERELPR